MTQFIIKQIISIESGCSSYFSNLKEGNVRLYTQIILTDLSYNSVCIGLLSKQQRYEKGLMFCFMYDYSCSAEEFQTDVKVNKLCSVV